MKKLFSVILVVINLNCFGQSKDWFISFSIAPAFGGPSSSLKSQMKAQGYGDQSENTTVLFGPGNTSYPRGGSLALLARGGKKISDHKSIYFVTGVSEKATIEGYDAQGWSDGFFSLFAGTYGEHVSVSYTTYQLTAGYMYSFSNSRVKIGAGPSVYLLRYGNAPRYLTKVNHASVVPGAAFTTRLPLGKEKKLFGVEWVIEGNIAPQVKMKSGNTEGFQPKSVNMFSANAGFAFIFRK